jgi:hypothetical protein
MIFEVRGVPFGCAGFLRCGTRALPLRCLLLQLRQHVVALGHADPPVTPNARLMAGVKGTLPLTGSFAHRPSNSKDLRVLFRGRDRHLMAETGLPGSGKARSTGGRLEPGLAVPKGRRTRPAFYGCLTTLTVPSFTRASPGNSFAPGSRRFYRPETLRGGHRSKGGKNNGIEN